MGFNGPSTCFWLFLGGRELGFSQSLDGLVALFAPQASYRKKLPEDIVGALSNFWREIATANGSLLDVEKKLTVETFVNATTNLMKLQRVKGLVTLQQHFASFSEEDLKDANLKCFADLFTAAEKRVTDDELFAKPDSWCASLVASGLRDELTSLAGTVRSGLGLQVQKKIRICDHIAEAANSPESDMFKGTAWGDKDVIKRGILALLDLASEDARQVAPQEVASVAAKIKGGLVSTIDSLRDAMVSQKANLKDIWEQFHAVKKAVADKNAFDESVQAMVKEIEQPAAGSEGQNDVGKAHEGLAASF